MTAFALFYINFIWSFIVLKISFELFDGFVNACLDYKEIRKRHIRTRRFHIGRTKFHK